MAAWQKKEEDQLQEHGSTWQGQGNIPVQLVKETFHSQEEDLGLEQELGLEKENEGKHLSGAYYYYLLLEYEKT